MSSGSGPAPTTRFDAAPLTEPVDRAAVRAFARQLRARGQAPGILGGSVAGSAVAVVVFVVVGFAFLGILGSMLTAFLSLAAQDGGGGMLLFGLVPVLVVVGVVAIAVAAGVGMGITTPTRWYRLDRFARANAMSYQPQYSDPPLPGMIFQVGSARMASDLVRGDRPRFVEFGNYRYTTGSGKNRSTHRWGYVAVKLDVPLPHIVLDATSNDGLFGTSNLPVTFDRDQRLGLEGDFDRYFTLHAPEGYERDALYLFTPDLMARFIDRAAAVDVEIVDDWLFLYAKRDFSTLDPATWAWLFSVVGALLEKLERWARWRDERLAPDAAGHAASAPIDPARANAAVAFAAPDALLRPPPGVAAPGRRLTRGVSWITIGVFVVVAVVWMVRIAGGALDSLLP
ncbi:MAG TPA: hypothetical protein VFS72_02045 [Agromyces sp.]|nr:hypothetical protein [Agromyces sp.]